MITIENGAFAEALHRLSEFFAAPILDPGYIQKEKNAVNASRVGRALDLPTAT
ncbi:hypothetical protein N9M70_05975 [Luminiphilus sp.]|nr:hypothetical protein [Luminiphilus sp.]